MVRVSAPALETNACRGTYVLSIAMPDGWVYKTCPGCIGCDRDTVAARMAHRVPVDPFARIPAVDDGEW